MAKYINKFKLYIKKTILSYCLKCRKNTESKNPKVAKTLNGKIMLLSKCSVCDSEKSIFVKEQQARGLLRSLGIRTPLSKVPLIGTLLFKKYKMNEIVNTFLLSGDKFMPKMHLKQPGFTYSACGSFTKNKETIKKIEETGD